MKLRQFPGHLLKCRPLRRGGFQPSPPRVPLFPLHWCQFCLLLALTGWGCAGKPSDRAAAPAAGAPPTSPAVAGSRFEEITERSGIGFVHLTGATGEKYLPETLASGVCVLDYDGDQLADLYFVSGAALGKAPPSPAASRLYRNRGDATFEDVTKAAGVAGAGYGIGCAVGDVDGDGRDDLYVANYGPNLLYRNRGDGTFEDITAASGTGDPSFSTGATFVDVDGDGDLDLYVVNYMDYRVENNKYCGEMKPGYRTYCGPEIYPGAPDRLYRNDGNGRFTDISAEAGIANPDGRGLGVLALDYDQDGDMDLYVANDGMANYLYRNDGKGRFTEVGLLAGAALADDGRAQAGMGVDAGDYDGDGWEDFFVANLSFQPSSLYRNLGDGSFAERSFKAGLAGPTFLMTGYGAGFFDFDNDGWLDLFQANGHMMDNVQLYFDNLTFPEPAQLFRNRGDGTFEDVTATRARDLERPSVGRGSAFLDLENDGDLDLVMLVAGGAPRLFRNVGGEGSHFLQVELRGKRSNRDGFGARLRLRAGGREQLRTAKAASGYASQSEAILHFGLGKATKVDALEVRWPSGTIDRLGPLEADRRVWIEEGSGRAETVRKER